MSDHISTEGWLHGYLSAVNAPELAFTKLRVLTEQCLSARHLSRELETLKSANSTLEIRVKELEKTLKNSFYVDDKVLKKTILDRKELGAKIINILSDFGINEVNHLAAYSARELSTLRGIGKAALGRIREYLRKHNFDLID